MDWYQKVEKPRVEQPIDENEIRITSQGRMRSYITYAMTLLQEKGSQEIMFKAMDRAINKTLTIVELIKRRIVGLHQEPLIPPFIKSVYSELEPYLIIRVLDKKALEYGNEGGEQPLILTIHTIQRTF
ncbi:hypothetical protein QVD17_12758 [Tagetes erecta]|uniref:DNA/RNA-binding protein Alba-like domain-containing protein n=1 Tax=Tagetes erecta TaxID=13708 RepID=A0AAD8KZC1_TARER|nr:hypothetical protein QVD17_12758 [Tagetes erecta]